MRVPVHMLAFGNGEIKETEISVGDVIEYPRNEYHVVASAGLMHITKERFEELKKEAPLGFKAYYIMEK